MSALTGFDAVLVRTREPGAVPDAVFGPVQYQAEDSASGALTSAPGAWDEPADAGGPPRAAAATAMPAITNATTSTTSQRRSGL